VQPPAGGTTQPITGTATPGSTVAITGPGNTTLCTTTASVSGTFSCPVSVPTGVTPLTVTASGPGGSTTVPITVTATLATPCTTPIPGQVIAAATSPLVVNSSTNSFSYISGNSGTSTRWFIVPSTTASPNSGTGTITGNITFLNAGWYQVIFEETNSNQPAGCSIPGTVQSSLDVYISPLVVPCASPSSSTVLVTPSNGAVAIGGTASFSLTGGQPYQNVQWQVVPSTGSTPIVGTGSTAVVTFSQQGLYRIVFTLTNAGDLTCIPVQSVSSALVAVGLNPCASPSPITIVNTTSSSGTAATGTTQTFQAVGGIPGQMVWKVYPTTGVSSVSGIGGTATLTFSQAGNYVVTFLSVNSSLPLGCTMPTGLANNLGITIVNQPTVAITSPATNGTATTSPTVSGTATPGSVVTLTGPGNTTLCTTTASVSGIYSCPVNVPAGPNSITAVACNAGGCSTPAVTNFTAVGPPSLTVVQPPAGGTTQPITGTATPGSAIVITGPGNTTLCTTTASVSGTFSCPVTVSTGVTPVTVTASGPGGITSVPLSLTANGAPTVSIAGPPGAILTNSPTVSGTATPGSLVTIVGPGNLTLCTTTASANGSYACTVNLPTGPTTLTAIATNSGGTGTATTTVTVTGLVARVYLQGALINAPVAGRMRDDLRVKNLIPTTEPYTSLGFTQTGGGGGETIANPSGVFAVTGANAIVDWVLVELRNANAPTTIVATRSALVQADGDIVSVDGTSPITFGQGVTQGTAYYVSVRHRNHLGVMTASPVSTTASTVPVVDFTNAGTPVYQYPLGNLLRSTAPLATQDGLPALWAGNTFKDNQVVFQGPSNDVDPIFFDVLGDPGNTGGFSNYIRNNVYTVSDVDMNGRVIFQGPSNEVDTIFFEIMTHPDNVVNQYVNFIIRQQLP
ncbi:Ig-like domain-containing protein, partial [Spirosoma panaciterrae]|uniref:Ig-like domain-containing protein n=1 Tax=Spirosoma panaciterrae TaxID=496058 RepID=UPI0003713AA0